MMTNYSTKVTNHSRVLGWFAIVSVLVHGLLLAVPVNKIDKTLHVNLSSPLQVTVISSRSASRSAEDPEVKTKPAILQHMKENRTVMAKAEKKSVMSQNNSTIPKLDSRFPTEKNNARRKSNNISSTESSIEKPAGPTSPVNMQNVLLNHLRQQLKDITRTRFTYPRMARRMGWEGLVSLSLHIEDDGSLNQVAWLVRPGTKFLMITQEKHYKALVASRLPPI